MPKRHYLLHVGSWFIHAGIVAGIIGMFIFLFSYNIDFQNSLRGALLLDVKSQNEAVLILDTVVQASDSVQIPIYMKSSIPVDSFKFVLNISSLIEEGFLINEENNIDLDSQWKINEVDLEDSKLRVSATSLFPIDFINPKKIFSINVIAPAKSAISYIHFLCGEDICEVKNGEQVLEIFNDDKTYLKGYVVVDEVLPVLSEIKILDGAIEKEKKVLFTVSDDISMDLSLMNIQIFDDTNPTLVFPECTLNDSAIEDSFDCSFSYKFYEPYYFNIGIFDKAGNKNESYFGVNLENNKLWEFTKK